MKTSAFRIVLALVVCGYWAGAAGAELSVSVTIAGPVDEIIPLLQHFKDLGIGTGSSRGGPAKVEITSVGTPAAPSAPPAAPPPPPPPPPKPPLALQDLKVDPAAAKAGQNILITVKVSDPDHVVDTVAATIDGMPGSGELDDKGARGDATPGDSIWSAAVALHPQLPPGEHAITVSAFGANGAPVTTPQGNEAAPSPLVAKTKLMVQP